MSRLRADLHPDFKDYAQLKHLRKILANTPPNELLPLLGMETLPYEDTTPARVLIYDIETAPLKAYVWHVWGDKVGYNMDKLISEWFVLTWSAKWLFEEEVMSDKITPEELKDEDDFRVCRSLWELFDKADIVIAHNGLKFDNKRMRTRFLRNGLSPNLPFQTIDTLTHARKQLSVSSNRLDYLAKFLGMEGKMDTGGFDLWKRCMEGDEEAIEKMEQYNIKDVQVLEDVYLRMRPWINPHPNMGLFVESDVKVCPSCGSDDIKWGGQYATYANLFDSFRCNNCGSIGRSRSTSIPLKQRRRLTMSVPR